MFKERRRMAGGGAVADAGECARGAGQGRAGSPQLCEALDAGGLPQSPRANPNVAVPIHLH